MVFLNILIIVLLVLFILFFFISGFVFLLAFYNANKEDVTYKIMTGPGYDEFHDEMLSLIKKADTIPYEEVYIHSNDGLKLFGRLYFQKEGEPVHIQFHGYKDNGIKDFCGGLQFALQTGANVIVVDQRAHGKSEGHVISFGIKERFDVLCWIQYALHRFGETTPIFLEGISMGAATVLMASNLNLPQNVKGIFADCPYSNPYDIVQNVANGMIPCSKIIKPFVVTGAFVFGHFNIMESSAIKSVFETKVPILLIHGTQDRLVPIEMTRAIYEANPDRITKVEVDGAVHGLSYLKDPQLYKTSLTDFINRYH